MGVVPARLPEHVVQAVLILGVLGVEGLVAAVHIDLGSIGLERSLQVVDVTPVCGIDGLLLRAVIGDVEDGVGRETTRAAEHFRIFGDGIGGNQTAHARTHMEGVVPVRKRRVSLVDEGLQIFDEELEVVVAEEVFFTHSLAPRILLQLGRVAVENILGKVLLTSRTGSVCNSDDDAVLDPTFLEKAAKDLVDAPFLVVEHLFGVEKVLAVAHIDDGIFLLRRVVLREPDIDVSRRDKSRVGFKTRVEIEAPRRDVGLVGVSLVGLPGAAFRLHLSSTSHTVQHFDHLGEVHGLFLLPPLGISGDLAAVRLVGRKGVELLFLEFHGLLQRVHKNPLHIVIDVDGGVDSIVG